MHTTAPCMQYLKKILKEPLSLLTKRSSMIKKRVLQNVNCVLSEQRRGFQRASVYDKPSLPISNSCQLRKGTFVLLNRT